VGGVERSALEGGLRLGHRGWSSRSRGVRKADVIIPSPPAIFNRAHLAAARARGRPRRRCSPARSPRARRSRG
jgi:hypothetical protein